MCGRFTLTMQPEILAEWVEVSLGVDFPPRFNIAPTQPILVILDMEGLRQSALMRWGLVPNWVKDPREFPLIINARSETIMEKPSFRGSLRHHRCIIPASGYYEWRTGTDGKKQPYYITLKDGAPMAFAGVWSTWMGPEGEEIDSAAIITLPASPELKHIHDRMPAMLERETFADWLNVKGVGEKQAQAMLKPLPEGVVEFHPVSTRVGSIRNDDEGLVVEVTPDKPIPKKKSSGQMDLF